MGHLFSKKELDNATDKLKTSTKKNDSELYKAIEEFAWKNASPAEIHKDSLPHYAEKFKQFAQ
nr:hypothetical protein [uncultured Fluviicola sp.]